MERERDHSMDLLRIVATFAVILIHINYHYFKVRSMAPSANVYYVAESLINIVTRFSVPAFVMISGAFLLRNPQNRDFKAFYQKTSYRIGLPVLLVVFLFLMIEEAAWAVPSNTYLVPFKEILTGVFYNIWFMYMLAGLYLLTPLVIRLKEAVSEKAFRYIGIVLLIWACLSQKLSTEKAFYTIGVVFAFLSYFIAGSLIYEAAQADSSSKRRRRAADCLLIILMIAVTFAVRFSGYSYYLFEASTNFFSPSIMVISLCVFDLFAGMQFKKDCSRLAGDTFFIYLFHTLVYKIVFQLIDGRIHLNELTLVFLVTVVVFILSLGCAKLYQWLWRLLDVRLGWKKKWYGMEIWK
jgi:surface polysaccharide O-acyltransferase-like enzyme